ncbi:MAG: TonB-dependent receptor [Panacagrimonas sp.]|nr:TonB-dependent receptor [Panacagrimonas sp.]MCC2658039.1 TonB-dependent receptor [Panacagrimonas sp.]
MKRHTLVRAGGAPLLLALGLPATLAVAQPAAPIEVAAASTSLPTVVVIGTRTPQERNLAPAGVVVIDQEQIRSSGASHITEVLRLTSFVQVNDLYGDGSRATVDARGFGDTANANTLVLVDGRRLNNTDITPADLNSIPLKDVERIEILQGSGGALYGDQAVGGVINIITRTPGKRTYAIEADGGSYDAFGVRARLGDRIGDFGWRLSGETRESDNYRDHNDTRYGNVLGRVDWNHARGLVFAEAGMTDEDLLTPGALFADDVREDRRQVLPQFATDYSDTLTQSYRIGAEQTFGAWRALAEGTWRRTDGNFRISFVSGASSDDSIQDRKQGSFNPRVTRAIATPWGEGTFTLGADAQRGDYILVSPIGQSRGRQDQLDGYSQVTVPLPGRLEVTAGARYSDLDGEVRDDFTFTEGENYGDHRIGGGAGLAWRPIDSLRLYVRGDRNFRYAKIDEITSAVPFGGPASVLLDTQAGWSKEIGGEWHIGAVAIDLSAYRLDLKNEIVFDSVNFLNINLDRTRRDGATLGVRWPLLPRLTVAASARYVDTEVRSGAFKGNDVPLVANAQGSVSATWQAMADWELFLEFQGIGQRPFGGDFDNTLDDMGGYGLVNTSVRWTHGPWAVRLRVNNVFDRDYTEYGGSVTLFPPPDFIPEEVPAYYPSPGANGRLTLSYAW